MKNKMMTRRLILMISMCVAGFCMQAQTSAELLGKWKLVKKTKNGVNEVIEKDTYQVFREEGVFQGIVGSKTRKGKWSLSADSKKLMVKISIIKVDFTVEYFDDKRRVISSDMTGTLEYEKVPD